MFDLSKVPDQSPDQKFECIPEGYYQVIAKQVTWKESKTGNKYLEIQLQICEGQKYQKRIIFHRLNLMHESEKVRGFALRDLKKMLSASNVETNNLVNVSEEQLEALVYRTYAISKIVIEPGSSGYPDKNVVKGWNQIDQVIPVPASYNKTIITTHDIPF
jgi:hypothetical protein